MLNLAEEKRLYTRIRTEAAVNIYYGGFMLARCKTINLCVGGVLIHVKEVGLTENSLIQIMFDVASTHCLFEVRIPAIVLRCANNQIAASFEELEKGTEELISACYMSSYPQYY